MKHHIALISLGLIISACASSAPAPYELKGGKFYGKNASSSEYIDDYENSDVNNNFVYKGRSGSSSNDTAYQNEPDYSQPSKILRSSDYDNDSSITKKPLDQGITTTKLAPPPKENDPVPAAPAKLVDDHIDRYEDESRGAKSSSNVRVPTSRDKLTSYNDEPAPAKSKSSDYLDLKTVDDRPTRNNLAESKKTEEKKTYEVSSYTGERADKLKNITPREKPNALRASSEDTTSEKISAREDNREEAKEDTQEESPSKKALLHVSAKEKPRYFDIDDNVKPKEKPEVKEEAKVEHKPEPKPEPKIEAKAEPKPEPKIEAKAEPKAEPKKAKAEASLDTKEDAQDYINLPDKTPPAVTTAAKKTEVKPAEVKKAEVKKVEEPKEKPEIVSSSEKAEPEVKRQDIASIPKIEPASTNATGKFIKPVEGKIVQEFGNSNDGIRIQAAEGTPVKAAGSGEVVYSGNELQGYGNMVVIKHPNGFLTAYSHLENLPVKKGAKVSQGEVIGAVGKTGNVQSPQLHFGVRKGRNAVNPRDYLN